jgi:hypothetical protein
MHCIGGILLFAKVEYGEFFLLVGFYQPIFHILVSFCHKKNIERLVFKDGIKTRGLELISEVDVWMMDMLKQFVT